MNIDCNAILDSLKRHKYPYMLLGLSVILSLPILRDLISDWWRDDNYSHGFLIIPLAIGLFYQRRKELVFPSETCRWGMALLLLGCATLILGTAAREFFTTRLSLVMIVTGLSLYYLGYSNFKKVWFSFFFLLFMIPIPAVIYYSATLPMQLFSSKITTDILQMIGVPCIRQGNIIIMADYQLEVAEACSGLRSLVTLMALSSLYAYLKMPGKAAPVILFLTSIPIAIATNILRILVTAIGAYVISPELAEGFLHEISGIMVFMTALILLVIMGAVIVWIKKRLS